MIADVTTELIEELNRKLLSRVERIISAKEDLRAAERFQQMAEQIDVIDQVIIVEASRRLDRLGE